MLNDRHGENLATKTELTTMISFFEEKASSADRDFAFRNWPIPRTLKTQNHNLCSKRKRLNHTQIELFTQSLCVQAA